MAQRPTGLMFVYAVMQSLLGNCYAGDPWGLRHLMKLASGNSSRKHGRHKSHYLHTRHAAGGGTTEPVTFIAATLNVGGDGPQAEYLGSDWEKQFEAVEVRVGAKLIFLANYNSTDDTCKLGTYAAWYKRYVVEFDKLCVKGKPSDDADKDVAGKDLIKTKVKEYVLSGAGDAGAIGEIDDDWKFAMNREVTLPAFAKYLMYGETGCFKEDFKQAAVEAAKAKEKDPKKKDKVKFPGLSDLDKDKACKKRAVFPFFGKNFMQLHGAGEEKLNKYIESINKECENKNSPAVPLYIPLLAFDFFVLQEFATWADKNTNIEAVEFDAKGLPQAKQALVKTIYEEANIFFVQESEDILSQATMPLKSGTDVDTRQYSTQTLYEGKAVEASEVEATAVQKKTEFPFDTSILCKQGKEEGLYGAWRTFVEEEKKKGFAQRFMVSNFEPNKEKGENVYDVDATTIITTKLEGGLKAMLMSAHPKSDGRPCVLFAYMAMRFFQSLPKEKGLQLLLVGMDANVLTDEDAELKKKKGTENGWTWSGFKEKCEYMGFHVIHDPERDTVHKQRSFLQTQLKKAAKKDKTKKDILLAYSGTHDIKVNKVAVYNTVGTEVNEFGLKFGYNEKTAFPTNTWPLDHFLTIAKITVTPATETPWQGLQDFEDSRYEETKCDFVKIDKKVEPPAKAKKEKELEPKLAGNIRKMKEITPTLYDGDGFNWCKFRETFNFANDNNDYLVRGGDMKDMEPELKREDWASYNSHMFDGKVRTYRGEENAGLWSDYEDKTSVNPPAFPVKELPSDHLPVILDLFIKGSESKWATVGTFNVLSNTKSSQSAASFPGFPDDAWKLHNGWEGEGKNLDITASSTWIATQLMTLAKEYDFDVMALQEIDYPMYNALARSDINRHGDLPPGFEIAFDVLHQCPPEKRAAAMEVLRLKWSRGKYRKSPAKDVPAIVWNKQKLDLKACAAVGTISSIAFCRFEKKGTDEKFNLLAMHGDGDKGFREEEAEFVRKQIGDITIHAVVGDLNLHDKMAVEKSMSQLNGKYTTMAVPDHEWESVYRYVHPFRKVIQNLQNSDSYVCKDKPLKSLKCPESMKGPQEGFKIDFDAEKITSAPEFGDIPSKGQANFYKLCDSYIWARQKEEEAKAKEEAKVAFDKDQAAYRDMLQAEQPARGKEKYSFVFKHASTNIKVDNLFNSEFVSGGAAEKGQYLCRKLNFVDSRCNSDVGVVREGYKNNEFFSPLLEPKDKITKINKLSYQKACLAFMDWKCDGSTRANVKAVKAGLFIAVEKQGYQMEVTYEGQPSETRKTPSKTRKKPSEKRYNIWARSVRTHGGTRTTRKFFMKKLHKIVNKLMGHRRVPTV